MKTDEEAIQRQLYYVRDYYRGDSRQKRQTFLICGFKGSGKTSVARTCRKPIHIDSFDPGGTTVISDMIESGDVIADVRFEDDDPLNPDRFAIWMKSIDKRINIGYFDKFGTYMLDSSTTWGNSIMYYQLASHNDAGNIPTWKEGDYVEQKNLMQNYIKKLMRLPCDVIVTAHLDERQELISYDKPTGIKRFKTTYRFFTVGKAVITIPILFDEFYVLQTEESSEGNKRIFLLDGQGKYQASSRLRREGRLDITEPANIKAILKKIGLSTEDKPRLVIPDSLQKKEVDDEAVTSR